MRIRSGQLSYREVMVSTSARCGKTSHQSNLAFATLSSDERPVSENVFLKEPLVTVVQQRDVSVLRSV